MENSLKSHRFSSILTELSKIYKVYGLDSVGGTAIESKKFKFWKIFLKISAIFYLMLFVFGSFEYFSANDKVQRLVARCAFCGNSLLLITKVVFNWKNETLTKLLDWCHWAETHKVEMYPNRGDWFGSTRNKSLSTIRLLDRIFKFQTTSGVVLTPIALCYFYGERRLMIDLNICGFEENKSLPMYLIGSVILTFLFISVFRVVLFSLSLFTIFGNYILGQLELLKFCINSLDLTGDVPKQLHEVTDLHLDVLGIVKELSSYFICFVKFYEMTFTVAFIFSIVGFEMKSPILCSGFIVYSLVYGYFAFKIDQVTDAENELRDAYYELNWLDAKVEVQRIIRQAMEQPTEIKFAAVFGKDKVSLERFGDLFTDSYDFALIFIKLAKG